MSVSPQGQELAVINSGDLAQAYSDDQKARTLLGLTKQIFDRQLALEKGGGAAVKDREQAQSDYAQAQFEFDRAETRLRSLGVSADQLERTSLLSLKAPIAGSVIDLEVAPGDFLNDPTATIMTIANLDTVWVTANVPEKDTSFVFAGQSVDVAFPAYPGETFSGKVLFVSDVLEPDTRRTKVRIAFDNPSMKFKPNMFANASFAAPMVSRDHGADVGACDEQRQHQRFRRGRALGLRAPECRDQPIRRERTPSSRAG